MKLKKITSLFCAGALLFAFAAAPIAQAQAYTSEEAESGDGEHVMPEVVAQWLANPVNHYYDTSVWAQTNSFPFDHEFIMPDDTFEIHPFTVSSNGKTTTTYAGSRPDSNGDTAPYFELVEGNLTDGFEIEGEVEPVEFETKTISNDDESVTVKFCVKWKNNTNCPLILGCNATGHGSFIGWSHYDYFIPYLSAFSPYNKIIYPGDEGYTGGDIKSLDKYFWQQGELSTLDLPREYWITETPYTITLPNPVYEGRHFLRWGTENTEQTNNGLYTDVTVCFDYNNGNWEALQLAGDVKIAPHFRNARKRNAERRNGRSEQLHSHRNERGIERDVHSRVLEESAERQVYAECELRRRQRREGAYRREQARQNGRR